MAGGNILFGTVKLLLISVVLWEMAARVGDTGAAFLGRTGKSRLERCGLGLLLGWSILGPLYLALALTGLFLPGLVIALPVAIVAANRRTAYRHLMLLETARSLRPPGRTTVAIIALVAALLLPRLLTPEIGVDPYMYHLATPWQWLQSHRMLIDNVLATSHLPLPVDLVFALPLALGDDRLAKWIAVSFFLAASAVVASHCDSKTRNRGGLRAGGLIILLALATTDLAAWLPTSKNDVAATSLLVAGAVLYRGGSLMTGAVLLGCGVTAKLVYAPLVLAWVLVHPPGIRGLPLALAVALVPALPWFAKSFLISANPLPRLLEMPWPTFDWDARNTYTYRAIKQAQTPVVLRSWGTFPGAWLEFMARGNLLVTLAIPVLLIFGRSRRATGAVLVGAIVTVAVFHLPRYLISSLWLLGVLLGEEVSRFSGNRKRAAAALAGGFSLIAFTFNSLPLGQTLRDAAAGPEAARSRLLSEHEEVGRALRQAGRRFLCVAELRTYRLPGRPVQAGGFGETPLVWKLVNESAGPEQLRKRLRQLGISAVAYNFISADWVWEHYTKYPWTDQTLRLYNEFCLRYLEVRRPPKTVDSWSGGFYVYRLRARPASPAPHWTFFLPGTEAAAYTVRGLRDLQGDTPVALRGYRQLLKSAPGVGHFVNQIAYTHSLRKEWGETYRLFKPFVERGMIDAVNLPTYGLAALETGRLEEAVRIIERCLEIYPGKVNHNKVNLAVVLHAQAEKALQDRRLDDAAERIEQARRLLATVEVEPYPDLERPFRETREMVIGLEVEMSRRRVTESQRRKVAGSKPE